MTEREFSSVVRSIEGLAERIFLIRPTILNGNRIVFHKEALEMKLGPALYTSVCSMRLGIDICFDHLENFNREIKTHIRPWGRR